MTKDEALKMAIDALSQDEGWFEPEEAINACKEALERQSNMVAVHLDNLQDMQRILSDCEEYLKEDETPAECIARNRKDANTTLKLLAKCMGEKKALKQPAQETVGWNEEEFNEIAYAYRICPAHEVKMVSKRYQDLVAYVLSLKDKNS